MKLANTKTKDLNPDNQVVQPVMAIIRYVWDEMKRIDPSLTEPKANGGYAGFTPFFPVSDASAGAEMFSDRPYVLYNKLPGRAKDAFYPVRTETFIFNVKGDYKLAPKWIEVMRMILDRQDDAAKDINKHNGSLTNVQQVYFHNLRVFQIEATAPDQYVNKPDFLTDLLIKAEYHLTQTIDDLYAK